MQKWILPTISEILYLNEIIKGECQPLVEGHSACDEDKFLPQETGVAIKNNADVLFIQAEGRWRAAIAALEQLLIQVDSNSLPLAAPGLVFTGPVPVLSHRMLSSLPTWIFRPALSSTGKQFQLPPAAMSKIQPSSCAVSSNTGPVLTLLPGDPLASEQFCLVLTAKFSLVMVLGNDHTGSPAFLFSFDPEVVEQTWRSLQRRIALSSPHLVSQLDALIEQYYPVAPDYQIVTKFTYLLLKYLPVAAEAPSLPLNIRPTAVKESYSLPITINPPPRPDVELIQAFAHEIRTPLTTIRTHTRLLLKRRELSTDVSNRLKTIDRECSEQIERMELLFQAAELQSTAKHSNTQLTAISLSQVLQQSIPRWQSSANRRNLTLDVALPQQLPTVVSDPMMLDRVLTGLIEKFTRSLPPGSHIQVQVIPAGDQLKLQLLPQTQPLESDAPIEQFSAPPSSKSIGPLLMFEPETGNISLNLAATKHLFQAIGGKLIVRQRPHQGEVLTIFLPLEVSKVRNLDLKQQLATGH